MADEVCWLNDDCILGHNHEGACRFPSWFVDEDIQPHIMSGSVDVTVGNVIQTIGRWQARRREPLHDPDKEYHYECLVRFNDEQWNTQFLITHVYADGAGVLIQKIFARYAEIKKKAAQRAKEQLTPTPNTPDPVPQKYKSERVAQMELEQDLREIKHKED